MRMRMATVLAAVLWSAAEAVEVSWVLEPVFYADNTEHFVAGYPPGETVLGNGLKQYLQFLLPGLQVFRFGVAGEFRYGDAPAISKVRPVCQYRVSHPWGWAFVFGNLELRPFAEDVQAPGRGRHGLHRAVQAERLEFDRPDEYGFQSLLSAGPLRHDAWVNWNLLNTPSHREWFDAGQHLYLLFPYSRFGVQGYVSHHGGQLHHAGPVGESMVVGADVALFYRTSHPVFQEAGMSYAFLADRDIPDRGVRSSWSEGSGHMGTVWLKLFRFRLFGEYWLGKGFRAEEGDPVYRTERDYVSLGVDRRGVIGGGTEYYMDLRWHWLEGVWEYRYGFGVKGRFSLPVYKG